MGDDALHLFAGLPVSDFDRGVAFVEGLLGSSRTFEAHDTDWAWTLAEHRSVYVVLQPDRAGSGTLTVFVDDVDAFVSSAASRGIRPASDETYDNGVRKVVYVDPDGNEIGVAGNTGD